MDWKVFLVLFSLFVCAMQSANKVLFRKTEGRYLKDSMIRITMATNEFECGAVCSHEPLCVSVNYKNCGKEKGKCELNYRMLQDSEDAKYFKNPEYSYLEKSSQVRKELLY